MLALTISAIFALYIFGPDAISRFILDFTVPRRVITQTKSQEVSRAVLWAGISLAIAFLWDKFWGTLAKTWNTDEIQVFFSGIYSEQFFRDHREKWFESLHTLFWFNFCLLWRLYAVVLLIAGAVFVLVRYYGRVRALMAGTSVWKRGARMVLSAVLLPRIAPWHVLLSGILLPDRKLRIHIDVLTKMNIMYQGVFVDKTLAPDGALLSLTLAKPKRFQREDYLAAKAASSVERETGVSPAKF